MDSVCMELFDQINDEKKNGLLSFPDIITIKSDILVNRMFISIFNKYVSIPNFNTNFIFYDHTLPISPFDILKEFSNISVLYLFSEYIMDIIERKISFGIYYNIKLKDVEFSATMECLEPFIIYNDNKINKINLPKYSKYHDLIKLPEGSNEIEIKSRGFLLGSNVKFDEILIKNLSETFSIDYDDIKREEENFRPLKKNFLESRPFYCYGVDNDIIFKIYHFLDLNLEIYLNNIITIIDNIFDIMEEKITNFDHTLYISDDGNDLRKKFHLEAKQRNYISLYISDIVLSQVCSCIFISNGVPDGENYFIKDKDKELDINNLLGLVKKNKKNIIKNLTSYFEKSKFLYKKKYNK